MFKSVFQLFKIARKLAVSGAVDTINEVYKVPFAINIFFDLFSIGSNKKQSPSHKKPGERLCDALERMGTTFIKLGPIMHPGRRHLLWAMDVQFVVSIRSNLTDTTAQIHPSHRNRLLATRDN